MPWVEHFYNFHVRYSDYDFEEDDSMYTYSCGTPAYQAYQPACEAAPVATGGGFSFILVLFILLAIICNLNGSVSVSCCNEQPSCSSCY